jgi:hypothetical protein
MNLPELHGHVHRLGIKLSVCGDRLHFQALPGVVTPEIKSALAEHKAALVAMLARPEQPELLGPRELAATHEQGYAPIVEPTAAPLDGEGEALLCLPSHWWRDRVARWPTRWRAAWGLLANAIQDQDQTATWDVAERGALSLLGDRYDPEADPQHVLDAITEMLGWPRIVLPVCTSDTVIHRPLADAEVARMIRALEWRAASPLVPARTAEHRPRDVRMGDRWLPWHFRSEDQHPSYVGVPEQHDHPAPEQEPEPSARLQEPEPSQPGDSA